MFTAPRSVWPDNVYQFTPPTAYAGYWAQMEACSGLSANFARVTWFKADSVMNIPDVGTFAEHPFGFADWKDHRIALSGNSTDDAVVVRHEMLHELLQRDGHPPEFFGVGGKCFAEVTH